MTTMMRANARGRKDEEHVAIEGRRSRQGQQHDGQQRQTKQHNYQKVHIHLCYNLVVDCSHPCSTRYYFRCTDPNILHQICIQYIYYLSLYPRRQPHNPPTPPLTAPTAADAAAPSAASIPGTMTPTVFEFFYSREKNGRQYER